MADLSMGDYTSGSPRLSTRRGERRKAARAGRSIELELPDPEEPEAGVDDFRVIANASFLTDFFQSLVKPKGRAVRPV